jgi:hypothetical protein
MAPSLQMPKSKLNWISKYAKKSGKSDDDLGMLSQKC